MTTALRSRRVSIKNSPNLVEGGLGEIYQSIQTKMALLAPNGDEFIRITPYVLCRDFLVDVYTFTKRNQKFGIYGMSFNPKKDQPSMNEACLALKFPSQDSQNRFDKQLDVLHSIELANEFKQTEYIPLEDKTGIIIGDKKWLGSCLLWSLYTSLARILCYDLNGENDFVKVMRARFLACGQDPQAETDAFLVNSVSDATWNRILSNLKELELPEFCGLSEGVRNIHHTSGFYSVFGTHQELDVQTLRTNKHWQHFKSLGWDLYNK